ncbi:glycoside hydrolase family 43 protein [Paenibacillus turpanensis]|uniref:glycoside hydrolase family 43 protein n=1 Tax=Paenibacillus turpanensis TaxID=2689078 RepID=UPI00313300FB
MSERTYTNPILPGFHPDPSIVRVGEDYYMVNSTFQFFPAIVISHSRDLVHWEYIGHGIERSEDIPLRDLPDSFGIWAPDISYVDGTFYIFATLRLHGSGRVNIMVQSERPEGPYSKPVVLNELGLDPSHFVDDDGTRYMVYGGGGAWIQKLSPDSKESVGEPIKLWEGTGRASPEGPHILKKDGYYYIILAEGGTEYGHCITVARSRELFGSYEPCPFNPVHTQRDPNAPIQRAGHGKLVQTQHGEWWIVHLGGRPVGGPFCTLGRETYLEPVQWTADGWFQVNEGRGPSVVQQAPRLEETPYSIPDVDDFDGAKLPLHWNFARNPYEDNWSLRERPGHVRIWTADAELQMIEAQNVIVRREMHHCYTASLKLEFHPEQPSEQAGLVCYYDSRCFISLVLTYKDGLKVRLTENRARTIRVLQESDVDAAPGPIYLKVQVDGQRRSFAFSIDNANWQEAGVVEDATFLSDEGTQEKKAFTGTMVGFFANNGGSGRRIAADVDWFRYEAE